MVIHNTPLTPINIDDIQQAAERLKQVSRHTPLLESTLFNEQVGGRVLIKPECLQVTGSFKIRGAYNKISGLSNEQKCNGVVAFSSGNHAQGVAMAARNFGIQATIVMPEDAPEMKIKNTRALGAEVVLYDRYSENREEIGQSISDKSGAALVKPYDDLDIITGQATLALEALQDCAEKMIQVDQIVCPCGGGGLISGVASASHHLSPTTTVFAAEPEHYDDTIRSLKSGNRETSDSSVKSICDSIITPQPGEITFGINRNLLAGGYVVTESHVRRAMQQAFEFFKLVVEPGGAAALAAITSKQMELEDRTTLAVLSGGNVDSALFSETLARTW